MFNNYFKTAWRNLLHNKAYSLLNIFGLATGMAVALLIGLWAYYQYSFDRFLPGYQQLYQIRYRTHVNGVTGQTMATALPLGEVMKKNMPGIEYAVTTDWTAVHSLATGEKKLSLAGTMVGEDFLKMFGYTLIKGNAGSVLQDPYSIVLTASTAKALFGSADPINKIVKLDNQNDLKVTGILEDLPGNSTFQFNYLVPFSYYIAIQPWVKQATTNWENAFLTYIKLQPHVSYAQVEPALKGFLKKYHNNNETSELFMQPAKDWHLYSMFKNGVASGGLIDYVNMFCTIGLLVLIIACINFMNLSTARSEKRAKEVGIRKAVGSLRSSLIFQFLMEAILIAFAAGVLSILLVQFVLPSFNTLTQTNITIPYSNIFFWLMMIGYVLFTGLLAGSRPAFYLSSFDPVRVLKGAMKGVKQASLSRKVLVTLQFSCSIALIIGTIIIYQQIQYAKNRPIGLDINRLLITTGSADLDRNYPALKNELLQTGVVSSITKASAPVTELNAAVGIDDWQGKMPDETLVMNVVVVNDVEYFNTLGMQFSAGHNFSVNDSANMSSVILNEAAAKRLRLANPENQMISFWNGQQRVIGVVKDALMTSPFADASPTLFAFYPEFSRTASYFIYRISPSLNVHDAIAKLTPIFNKYNPSHPYQYQFADDNYAAKFNMELLIGKLAGLFAALAIFISCLGLFGLAAYMAEQRTKEIGIRKILGASVQQMWMLLSKEFVVLVMYSTLIASPVAYYYVRNWLQQYDYRINISPLVFVMAGAAAIVITIVTISFQAIKAATANPVKSLRTE